MGRGVLATVGGLAVHDYTRDRDHPVFPGTATLDVDFGISLGTDAGMAASVQFALAMAGCKQTEGGRMLAATGEGNLCIDFLAEHPPAETGSRTVSDVRAPVRPGINRALADGGSGHHRPGTHGHSMRHDTEDHLSGRRERVRSAVRRSGRRC